MGLIWIIVIGRTGSKLLPLPVAVTIVPFMIYKGIIEHHIANRRIRTAEEMKCETKERLSRLERCAPNEIRVYRGVCDKSSSIETSVSWTPNINVAYFFTTRLGKNPSIITGRVKENDIIEYLTKDCDNAAEEEVLVTPGTVVFEKEEPLYDMESEEIEALLPEAMEWYYPFKDILKELYQVSDNTNTAHDALHSLRVLQLASFLGVHEHLDYDSMNALCFAAVYSISQTKSKKTD